MRGTVAALITLVLCATLVHAADVTPPLAASVPLRDGQIARGHIVAFDGESFDVRPARGEVRTVRWADAKPQAVYALHEKLLGPKGTAAQWVQAGAALLKSPDGAPLAERAFARALKLDPAIKPQIEAARQEAPTPAAAGAATAPAEEDAAGARGRGTATGGAGGAGGAAGGAAAAAPGEEAGADTREEPPPDVGAGKWEPEDEAKRAASVAQLKAQVEDMLRTSKFNLHLHETKFFLLYSDLSQTELARWVATLDRMYARMAGMFGIKPDDNIWKGKAVVVAFRNEPDFLRFEKEAFKHERRAAGVCHYGRDGSVIITIWRLYSEQQWSSTLTHESSHGFLFRHRGKGRIPTWVNEGLAEVMEFELVPQPGMRQDSDARARTVLRNPNALEEFFHGGSIRADQYPIARTMTEFLIRRDKKAYVEFVNAIKDGTPWEQALTQHYKMDLSQLVVAYGTSMGVPNLKPPG